LHVFQRIASDPFHNNLDRFRSQRGKGAEEQKKKARRSKLKKFVTCQYGTPLRGMN
jgi:hypothetical protein